MWPLLTYPEAMGSITWSYPKGSGWPHRGGIMHRHRFKGKVDGVVDYPPVGGRVFDASCSVILWTCMAWLSFKVGFF